MSATDEDAREAEFSDYLDGAMTDAERRAFEARLEADADLRAAFEAFRETVSALSGLHRMSAPQDFDKAVEETIHRRSAGRFFGRRAFGDRVPFELLAVVALVVLVGALLLIRYAGGNDAPARDVPPETREVIPRP